MDFLIQKPQDSGDGKSCLITDVDAKPLVFQVSKTLRKPCKIINSKISKNKIVCAIEVPPSSCRYFESLDAKAIKFLSNRSQEFFNRKLSSKDIKEMLIPSVIDKCIQVKIRDTVEIFDEKSVVPRNDPNLDAVSQYINDKSIIPRICIEGIYFWSSSCQIIMSTESIMVLEKQKPQFVFEENQSNDTSCIVTPFPQMITTIQDHKTETITQQSKMTPCQIENDEGSVLDSQSVCDNEKLSGIGCNFLTIVEEEQDENDPIDE